MNNPRRVTGVMTEDLGDGLAIYHRQRDQSYVLNATSALVWKHCDGQTSRRKLTSLIKQKFNVPSDQAKGLMKAALNELSQAALLETTEPQQQTYSRREMIRTLVAAGLSLALIPVVSPGTAQADETSTPETTTTTSTTTAEPTFDFSGFFPPVDNPPAVNSVKAGQAIPIKFSLNGDQGLDIFESGFPKSQEVECDGSGDLDDVEETATSGNSGLSYDPDSDQYTYVWKTEKSWSGTCRELVVKLTDGSVHTALFQFN